jgi:two-component system response regulator AtoC
MEKEKILIADDDANIIYAFREVLRKEGYLCLEAQDGHQAVSMVTGDNPDIVFMDINMPGMNGLNALKEIKAVNSAIPIIIITGEGTMQTAIQAMQYGAFQYLMKPLSVTTIREELSKALISLKSQKSQKSDNGLQTANKYQLIGNSRQMHDVYKLIGSVCTTPNHTTILITGETGTGKELVARSIHNNCANRDQPFVAVNCTALPETLLESELFGHEKGAFTGALEAKTGKFEYASSGTIFLDEIGDLPADLQIKLLRVLQEREMERLGGNSPVPVNARFIAATNQDLNEKILQGEFREDLFYRINIVNIYLPPLREHKEDIFLLANFFLARYNERLRKSISRISDEAMQLLKSYQYPGNIRELENIIERAVMLTQGNVLLPDVLKRLSDETMIIDKKLPINSSNFSEARESIIAQFEKQFITEKLAQHGGNVSLAAKSAGMTRQNFHRLMAKYHIDAKNNS